MGNWVTSKDHFSSHESQELSSHFLEQDKDLRNCHFLTPFHPLYIGYIVTHYMGPAKDYWIMCHGTLWPHLDGLITLMVLALSPTSSVGRKCLPKIVRNACHVVQQNAHTEFS